MRSFNYFLQICWRVANPTTRVRVMLWNVKYGLGKFAFDASFPSLVFGPVERPACNLQQPFDKALH